MADKWKVIYQSTIKNGKITIHGASETNTFHEAWAYVPQHRPWTTMRKKMAEQLLQNVKRIVVAYKGKEMYIIQKLDVFDQVVCDYEEIPESIFI
jgi:hypothetical protein